MLRHMNDAKAQRAAEQGMTVDEFDAMLEAFEREALDQEALEGKAAAAAWTEEASTAASSSSAKASLRRLPVLAYKCLADGSRGRLLPTVHNLKELLVHAPEWRGVLAFNELSCSIIKLCEPPFGELAGSAEAQWTDDDTFNAQVALAGAYGTEFARKDIDSAVSAVAKLQRFHPIRAALEKLTWDGKQRLDTWLQDYLGAKHCAYSCAVGPKILIGAVARVFAPGCKLDTTPILEGSQGARKSTVWRILAGRDEWFTDTAINIGDKDSYQNLRGIWFIEFAELEALLKRGGAQLEAVKAYLTASSDKYRPSYGRHVQTFERQCLFVGTTNEHEYLQDATGNRRFWPIACSAIDIEALSRDRDQLIAEAVWRYHFGVPWHLNEIEEALASAEQALRNAEDPWEPLIAEYLLKRDSTTMVDVLTFGVELQVAHFRQADQKRAASIMRQLGWANNKSARPVRWYPVNIKARAKEVAQ